MIPDAIMIVDRDRRPPADQQLSERETERRMDAAMTRALSTPHQPRKPKTDGSEAVKNLVVIKRATLRLAGDETVDW